LDGEPVGHGLDGGSSPEVGVHGGAAAAAMVVTFPVALMSSNGRRQWRLALAARGEGGGEDCTRKQGRAAMGNQIRRTVAVLRPEIQHSGDSPAPALDKMQNRGGEGCCTGVRRGKNVAWENGAVAMTGVL
jgi:hypothetical protein